MLYEESFRSVNGRDDVQYWIYVPAAEPAGVIQLIHASESIPAAISI